LNDQIKDGEARDPNKSGASFSEHQVKIDTSNLKHRDEIVAYLKAKLAKISGVEFIRRRELKKLNRFLFSIPPDFNKAKQHGDALKAMIKISQEKQENQLWKCWDRVLPDNKRKVGLWEDTKLLIEYGDGFPLLFQFIKCIIILFACMFLIQGLYFYSIIVISYYLADSNPDNTFINWLSVRLMLEDGEIDNTLVDVYEAILLITNMLMMVLACVLWIRQAKSKHYLDKNNKTDSDFAVMIANLPHTILNSDIRKALVENAGVDERNIVYFNKWYEYDEILRLKKQQQIYMQKKKVNELENEKRLAKGKLPKASKPPSK
jgi:hypothetical protein